MLGHDGSRRGTSWYTYCSKCESDPELYGNGVFKTTTSPIDNKAVCPCDSTCFTHTEAQQSILVRREAERIGYLFSGWYGDYNGSKTYLNLSCPEGHSWNTTSIVKFLTVGRRCPICAGNRKTTVESFVKGAKAKHGDSLDYSKTRYMRESSDGSYFSVVCPKHGEFTTTSEHHVHRGHGCPHMGCVGTKISEEKKHTTEDFIRKAKKIHKDKYDYSDTKYHRSFTNLDIKCNTCTNTFTQMATDHLSGCGCPTCSGKNQTQCYVFSVHSEGTIKGYKAGIANNFYTRLSRQGRLSKFDVSLYGVWEMPDTASCKAAERKVMTTCHMKYLTKEDYPDGYSETTCPSSLLTIVEIYESSGGVLLPTKQNQKE